MNTISSQKDVIHELRFKTRASHVGALEILKGAFISAGIKEEAIVELIKDPYAYACVYPRNRLQLRRLRCALDRLHLKKVFMEVRSLRRKDWQDRWKADFKPSLLGKTFVAVPAWLKDTYAPKKRTPVYIDTSLAFGTGLHETTRFMVELMERTQGRFDRFLDVGTGTGILSIVAHHCGAGHIRAVDVNPDCVRVARENFRRNGCPIREVKAADIHHYKENGRYDLVAANLVTHNLIKAKRRLVSLVEKGKYLAVSGVSLENYSYFRKAFQMLSLKCLKIIRGRDWSAFLYKKMA
jgi:ribosomal protein L11 methyltransferase